MVPNLPLDKIYRRWFWGIPPIRKVIYHEGEWSKVGQKRTMVLAGGRGIAQVVDVNSPHSLAYRLSSMTGLFAPLISEVEV